LKKRTYRSPKRRQGAETTRMELLAAARALLAANEGVAALTIDTVAARAGVARMTVYHHFATKDDLLESLYADLARRGGLAALPDIIAMPDPQGALDSFVALFGAFWASDPVVLRRLRALAALDPHVHKGITERDAWRRQLLKSLLRRLSVDNGSALDLIWALTSFEAFDKAAGPGRPISAATPRIQRAVRALLGVSG
jgi:AcrR family transcriptional regulator